MGPIPVLKGVTMGHINAKGIYRNLGKKIDTLTIRAPWNEAFFNLLKELYSTEEADLVIKMPYGLSSLSRVSEVTGYEKAKAEKLLKGLATKGLVMDLRLKDKFYYMPSPMFIGIFEFTMMRTGGNLNSKKWARLFHEYMHGNDVAWAANFAKGEKVSIMRALPHEEAIAGQQFIEILDYEKATSLVQEFDRFSIGLCSCRHEKFHLGEKGCDAVLESCSSFGVAADYLIRNGLAKEVSKTAMLENIARSKQLGLVLNADNVKKHITYICHCCKCCCNALLGISKQGYPNTIVTSTFIANVDETKCLGCGKCSKACPINAIEMIPIKSKSPESKKKASPRIDKSICLGCGVCGLKCNSKAMRLIKRGKRVIHPETTFERVILQCLERGTLQNQIFDNPQSITQKIMRGFVGGFLRLPPVKKSLMSDFLRSSFLASMKAGTRMQGKGWLSDM
jgi:ferredoxin